MSIRRGTVDYGPLRLDWDSNGTLTIARTDQPQSVQLSISEWKFVLRAAELMGWPVYEPIEPVEDD